MSKPSTVARLAPSPGNDACQPDYSELADRADSGLTTITGLIARDAPKFGPRGCIPILWCFCVQHSPQNPCRCMGPIVWMPEDQARLGRPSGRHADGGERSTLLDFDLDPATPIFIDETLRCRPEREDGPKAFRRDPNGGLVAVEEEILVPRFTAIAAGEFAEAVELVSGDPQLTTIAKKIGWGTIGNVISAFKAGWSIGTVINDYFGLSDKISDWMLKKFGPAGGGKH